MAGLHKQWAPCRVHFLALSIKQRKVHVQRLQYWTKLQATSTASVVLEHDSGKQITVFGVEHLEKSVEVAEFIMKSKPGTVVVETSVNPHHGSRTGQILTIDDRAPDDITNVFQQFGRMLSAERYPVHSPIWQQLKPSCGEQLVYIAGFAVSAKIMYGDRVKLDTYNRLAAVDSLAELDHAFGVQCWLNFEELLDGSKTDLLANHQQGAVDHIMLTERDAILCHTLDQAAKADAKSVVGVFGAAHLPGIVDLWKTRRWESLCSGMGISSGGDNDSESSTSTSYAPNDHFEAEDVSGPQIGADGVERLKQKVAARLKREEQAGVKRALLESVMRLKTSSGVLSDMMSHLPPVSSESWEPYCWTAELYNHPRMFLAALTREQLERVCCGRDCDMWDVLKKVRQARPVNGGPALNPDLVCELRALNFIFDPEPTDQALLDDLAR